MQISSWPNFSFRSTYEDFFLALLQVQIHIWRFLFMWVPVQVNIWSLSQISVPNIHMKILIWVAITKPKKIYMPVKNVMRIKLDKGLHNLLPCTNQTLIAQSSSPLVRMTFMEVLILISKMFDYHLTFSSS